MVPSWSSAFSLSLSNNAAKVGEMQKLHQSIEDRNFYKKEYDHYLSKVKQLKKTIAGTEKEEKIEKLKEQLTRNEVAGSHHHTYCSGEAASVMRRRSLQHGNGEAAMGEQRSSASKGCQSLSDKTL